MKTNLNSSEIEKLKQARLLLIEVQHTFVSYSEEYKALNEIEETIEKLLGII